MPTCVFNITSVFLVFLFFTFSLKSMMSWGKGGKMGVKKKMGVELLVVIREQEIHQPEMSLQVSRYSSFADRV